MKTVNINFKVSRSQRPEWSLRLVGYHVLPYYGNCEEGAIAGRLLLISQKLDSLTYYSRKLKRSCSGIKREIVGDYLFIYNTTGSKVILEISYN
jgi:hypothetical protein